MVQGGGVPPPPAGMKIKATPWADSHPISQSVKQAISQAVSRASRQADKQAETHNSFWWQPTSTSSGEHSACTNKQWSSGRTLTRRPVSWPPERWPISSLAFLPDPGSFTNF